ncbi:MAG: anthranilate phosphoribosyltransferase [Alphaproteobacteria bacterium BRH_c36]|nr:MAG: anthranilate phosphoribosyltransferase [Alphaproteobacteria bacterium BRH_c36]
MTTESDIKSILERAANGETFDEEAIAAALDALMSETANDSQRAAFLMALRLRGETLPEIAGAARLLRNRMLAVDVPAGAVDIVGTGGDSHGTYNVSTCAAIVAAGAGLTVAKHGNRSVSSNSGASEVLQALGVKIDLTSQQVANVIAKAGLAFMWAPMHHPAMKIWAPARAALKVRTLFNLLGPIANPGRVTRQVVGVFDARWVEPIADALASLGAERVWVVHGSDGMDELTTTGPTMVAEVDAGEVSVFEISPQQAGLPLASLDELKGGDATVNAQAIRDLLDGVRSAYRDIVCLNAGAALVVGERAPSIEEGVKLAQAAIDDGRAKAALEKLVAASNA